MTTVYLLLLPTLSHPLCLCRYKPQREPNQTLQQETKSLNRCSENNHLRHPDARLYGNTLHNLHKCMTRDAFRSHFRRLRRVKYFRLWLKAFSSRVTGRPAVPVDAQTDCPNQIVSWQRICTFHPAFAANHSPFLFDCNEPCSSSHECL